MVYITSKFVLITINIIYLVLGIVVFSFGLRDTLRNRGRARNFSGGIEIGVFTILIGFIGLCAVYFKRRYLSFAYILFVCGSILFKFGLVIYGPIVGDAYLKNYYYTYYIPGISSILSIFIVIDIASIILTIYLLSEKKEHEASYKLNNMEMK